MHTRGRAFSKGTLVWERPESVCELDGWGGARVGEGEKISVLII